MNNMNSKKALLQILLVLFCALIVTGTSFAGEENPPVLITSIGQSPDGRMINILAPRLEVSAAFEQLASPEIVKNFKIVIAVVGGSSKGLGAAGIDKDEELARAKALIEEVKAQEIPFLVMHVGGEARRGALSDAFLDEVVPYADHLIIVESGNPDDYFTKMSQEYKIPLESVEKIADTGELFKAFVKEHLE